MILRFYALVAVCLALIAPAARAQGGQPFDPASILEVEITGLDRDDVVRLVQMGIDIDGVWGSTARAYMPRETLDSLLALGFAARAVPSALALNPNLRADYHTFASLTAELQAIAAAHPDICQLSSIGNSHQGRALWFMKISDNVALEEDEPEFKYISTMHGDEPIGMELCMNLINLIVNSYGSDPQITLLVDEVEIWIMPLMNPDGYVAGSRYNAQGYDLNRSFPDRVLDPNNSPAGRPTEVQRVMNWAFGKSSVLSANFHSGALVVNYPYDSDPNPWATYSATPDDALFIEQSLTYSSLNGPMYNSPWFDDGITNGVAWYTAYGGMQDWNYVWMGCNEVTIELSDSKWPPYSQIPAYWDDNRASMLAYMELCLKGVRGVATDAATGQPVAATVRVTGIDHDVFTDPDLGDYYRMLLPGTYTLEYSAAGYQPKTVPGVVVGSGEAVRVDVALAPVGFDPPVPDIKVNGSDGPITVSHTQNIVMTIALDPGDLAGTPADWWVFGKKNVTYWWKYPGTWFPAQVRAYAGPLFQVNSFTIANAKLPQGTWTFTFAVDALNNAYEGTYLDTVVVTSN